MNPSPTHQEKCLQERFEDFLALWNSPNDRREQLRSPSPLANVWPLAISLLWAVFALGLYGDYWRKYDIALNAEENLGRSHATSVRSGGLTDANYESFSKNVGALGAALSHSLSNPLRGECMRTHAFHQMLAAVAAVVASKICYHVFGRPSWI